ncbi:DUF1566 domain-containing protein [Salinispirillum sp. LH 10-3-1]|uniref:DUF1566 domain-containing protein n=1 Tax=Salinispirillum sp. LH 10-3-1 TaxID=2952525 RepID=A0AB38YHF3_9GAMM
MNKLGHISRVNTLAWCLIFGLSSLAFGQGVADNRYQKISNSGFTVTAAVGLGPDPAQWACTLDRTTDLLWEIKTEDPRHLRFSGHRYTWFDAATESGVRGNPLTCSNSLGSQPCNTAAFIAAVNAANLCGHNDWRLPTLQELQSILDPMESAPAMNPEFFPNTPSTFFWTGTPYPDSTSQTWYVHVGTAFSYGNASRSSNRNVRLVRGGR